jgi:hypothetical protein
MIESKRFGAAQDLTGTGVQALPHKGFDLLLTAYSVAAHGVRLTTEFHQAGRKILFQQYHLLDFNMITGLQPIEIDSRGNLRSRVVPAVPLDSLAPSRKTFVYQG